MLQPSMCSIHDLTLPFELVPLFFTSQGRMTDVFAEYQKITLRETLQKKRYKNLIETFEQDYPSELDQPLGTFLLGLKKRGDRFYKEFLNEYGDEEYCEFSIQGEIVARKGIYCYTVDGDVKYIGRSRDPFKKRVNQGYGVIHPKNCYRDGQATNCHLNSLIAKHRNEVKFWVYPLGRDCEIIELEERLIMDCQPEWNTALKHREPELRAPSLRTEVGFWSGAVVIIVGLVLVAASIYRWKQLQ